VSPLSPGQFRLLSSAVPPLTAGSYRARLEQSVTQGGTVQPVERHLDVTAPQFSLPGTEVQSVFPPPNAVGGFDTRLAQIVLKRRTLPWERTLSPSSDAPWLALVLLTADEGTLIPSLPVTEVVPAAKHAALGVSAASGRCDCLETTMDVVTKVFPRADELPLLCHVREVSLADTELAGGDLDGYLAVVLGNRLPRGGLAYGAYLVSVEGRQDILPASPRTPTTDLGPADAGPPGGATIRFPVLARWSFTCAAGGDFQSLMGDLDVGSLGTVEPGGCPAVTPTGHVAVAHRTRRGEQAASWYRGPLTPREVARRDPGTPYFAADQARALATDGLEDISEAAAFELGRLLAMSDPRFLAALLAWRRATMAADVAAASLARVPGATGLGLEPGTAGRALGLAVLAGLSGPQDPLGPRIPLVDLGGVVAKQDLDAIADGLGVDRTAVRRLLAGDDDVDLNPAPPQRPLEPDFDALRNDPSLLASLRQALRERVAQVAVDAGLDLASDVFDPADERDTVQGLYGGPP
jgi:hypothetical protein